MKRSLYCISGLGADERIFANLKLDGWELEHLPWLRPGKKETIEAYATRMAKSIQYSSPFLLGVSFGGIIAIEIARQLPLQKLIIISSIKTTYEMPSWMRIAGALHLNKLVPMRPYKFTQKIGNNRLGVSNDEERDMVGEYRRKADPIYLEWAVDQVLNWKNSWQPGHIIHIHGDKDKIFPLKNIRPHHIIKDGTHFMIYNRAPDISRIIAKELEKE